MASSNTKELQLSINFDQESLFDKIPSLNSSGTNSKVFADSIGINDIACHFFDDFDEETEPKGSYSGSMFEVQSYRFGDSGMDQDKETPQKDHRCQTDVVVVHPNVEADHFMFESEETSQKS